MSGLVGGAGVSGSAVAPDLGALAAILSDPNAFSAAIKQFNDAKDAADAAVADSLVKVEQAKTLAANIIAEAQEAAGKLLADAKASADSMVADAKYQVDQLNLAAKEINAQIDANNKKGSAALLAQEAADAEPEANAKPREKAYSDAMKSAANREDAADIIINNYKARLANLTERTASVVDAIQSAMKGL